MVSTRGIKYKFSEGERVLCYEPDTTKAKVLYDSKVLGIIETKDKRGRRLVQYKIHFQGWNSSWDRRVNSDFVLKDTEENRQLQKDLAQKAQLQLAAYLYRKERKKQRVRKESNAETSPTSSNIRTRCSSEENSSCSTIEKNDGEFPIKDDCDSSEESSEESLHDEDRVEFKIGDKLKTFLDYDYEMIVKYKKQHILPSRIPAVAILENFVKQSAIKMVFSPSHIDNPRRRNPQLRPEKKEKEFEKIVNTISLLKEIADGLRVYFDFTLTDYLLYKNEKEQAASLLSEENLQNFSYVASLGLSPDFLLPKNESEALLNLENVDASVSSNIMMHLHDSMNASGQGEEPLRRKLRSHRSEDYDALLENCFSSIASTSSGSSTPLGTNIGHGPSSNLDFIKTLPPNNFGISVQIKEYLQKVLSWQILPTNAEPEPSMIFGATHLARLIVKMPDFLNASTMVDDRLKTVIQHLNSFVSYLESHKEWFGEHNYFKEAPIKSPKWK